MKNKYVRGIETQATGRPEKAGNVSVPIRRPDGNAGEDTSIMGSGPVHAKGIRLIGHQPNPRRNLAVKAPVPVLTEKTARRIADIDRVLLLADGLGEVLLEGIIRDIKEGDYSLILDGWEFDDPDGAAADIRALADRWTAEDGE